MSDLQRPGCKADPGAGCGPHHRQPQPGRRALRLSLPRRASLLRPLLWPRALGRTGRISV